MSWTIILQHFLIFVLLLQDITNLAPRKPDWDLKRDVAKKLERLERRTQKAIAELIRERLKKEQEDLVMSVNIGASANQNLDVDED
jgi:coiled-coil domain-containing protein 12